MRRLLQWLVLISLLVAAALSLADHQGYVQIEWLGYRITLATSLLVGGLMVLWIVTIWLSTIIAELWIWPEKRNLHKALDRSKQGLVLLTKAATAMALGHQHNAQAALKKARSHLDDAPLALLMQAQWYEKHNNSDEATKLYHILAADETTAVLGLRGLLQAAERKRDYVHALKLAKQAHGQFPKDNALSAHTIELMLRTGDISQAQELLTSFRAKLRMPATTRTHLRALILWFKASQTQDISERIILLKHATKLMPHHPYIPLALIDALSQSAHSATLRQICIAWAMMPSPELTERALQWLALQPAEKREKLARKITKSMPQHLESFLLLATCALAAHDPVSAQGYAHEAIALRESKRALTITGQCVSALEDAGKAQSWFVRASSAPKEEEWQCMNCGATHEAWQLFCSRCETCDGLTQTLAIARSTHIEPMGA